MNDLATTDSGLLADLERIFAFRQWDRPPDCAWFNSLWPGDAPGIGGCRLQFVVQDGNLPFASLSYAQRIAGHGLIATRPGNWHDAFNALTWLAFPRTKLALTLRLAARDGTEGGRRRTPEHDALTLFDECGVVLAATDPCFRALHAAHDWRGLFVTCRADFGRRVRPVVFGHGLCDQARRPYVGLTAKAWYVDVPGSWPALPPDRLCAKLDRRLAQSVPGSLTAPRQLLPLPVLGVPGWCTDNQDPGYYDNVDYFRPARRD